MSWYSDKARSNIDAKVALQAAGGGARALAHLARIPLDLADEQRKDDDIKLREKKLQNMVDVANIKYRIAKTNANAKVSAASIATRGKIGAAAIASRGKVSAAAINAEARKYFADRGLQGKALDKAAKEATAAAVRYQSDKRVEAEKVKGSYSLKSD